MGKGTETLQERSCSLESDLGEILRMEQECPGVRHVVAKRPGNPAAEEYYIVERGTDSISEEAKAYGTPLAHHPELLVYSLDDPQSGATIVGYEIKRHLVKNGLSLPEGDSLLSVARFAMLDHPEYFGRYPAPLVTPRGDTARYRELMHGVFSIETDHGETVLAVCYPLWTSCLPDSVRCLAEQTAHDTEQGIHNTLGFLFFPEDYAQRVLAELSYESDN